MDKKQKSILLFLIIILLTLPIAVYLVKQRQELRKKALQIIPSCNGLTIDKQAITLGETINLSYSVSHYGLIRYGKCPGTTNCRVVDTNNPQTLSGSTFTPTEAGLYVFEVNAYESDQCQLLCSAGEILYQNTAGSGGCDTRNHWQNIGSCTSTDCIKYVTVQTPTITPTCSVSKSGRAITFNWNGLENQETAKLWLENETRTEIPGFRPSAKRGPYNDNVYYYLLQNKQDPSGSSLEVLGEDELPNGTYYIHCDVNNPDDFSRRCAGNPFCNYEKEVNPSLPGGDPCIDWRSCSNDDNLEFTVSLPTGTPVPTQPPPTQPVPTPTSGLPSVTPTSVLPTPTIDLNSPVLNLKINFFGVFSEPTSPPSLDYKNQLVLIKIKTRTIPSNLIFEKADIVFKATTDTNGFYYGSSESVVTDIQPGVYYLLIKGPKHLQKRYDNVSLNVGVNDLDFSGLENSLLGGDLPLPQNGDFNNLAQDGKVNSLDYAFVVNNFNKTETDILRVADLNLDGIINTGDTAVIAATLAEKIDEDE